MRADTYRHLPVIHADAMRLPRRNLSRLAALPCVAHVSPDSAVIKCDEFTVGSSEADLAAQQYGLTGQGITVAVLDSGVTEHTDLQNQTPQSGDSKVKAHDSGGSRTFSPMWT